MFTKKFLLAALIGTVISLGVAGSNASAMSGKNPAEHPTAEATDSEHPKADEPATSAEGLERLLEEQSAATTEKVATNKPKDHPAH